MPEVTIVRNKLGDETKIGDMVRTVLDGLGGLGKFIEKKDNVILKPNLVTNRKYFTGATTDPLIITEMIRELKSIGVSDITVADSSWVGCPTERAFSATGMKGICDREGAKLLDLKMDKYIDVKVPEGIEVGGTIKVAQTILDADRIINLPKLKAHCQTLVTLSLKNLKGCISDDEKQRFHRLDLDRAVAELNTVIKPDLIVMDAIVGEMTAELGCDPVRFDTVIAGTDPVAVDSICATMMGYEPEDIEHIVHAQELGCGTGLDLSKIKLIGDVPLDSFTEQVKESVGFERYTDAFSNFGLKINAEGACSSCMAGLMVALKRFADDDTLADLKGKEIYLGQNVPYTYTHLVDKKNLESNQNCIGIGSCNKDLEGLNFCVKGCPPSALAIYKKIKNQ
jgi:uncharacterized protein (DUF362 family)